MTENYYLTQQLLPHYFSNEKNKEFFYKVIGCSPKNLEIFFEKELYGWVKEDFYRAKTQQKDAKVPEEDKVWQFEHIKTIQDMTGDWITIFIKFAPDFVFENLDTISMVIAMKGTPETGINVRLFFLELGENILTKEKCVYIGERTVDDKVHHNYGTIDFNENFMLNFKEKIEEILLNK